MQSKPFYGWHALILGGLCLLLYANTFDHGYVLDDEPLVRSNKFVQKGLGGVADIFTTSLWKGYDGQETVKTYRPLPLFFFALEYDFFGPSAGAHHVGSVLAYALLCLAVYALLYAWLGQGYPWLASLAALVFAVHPAHTEVVANIKSRDEVLALLFGVLALLALFRHARGGGLGWLLAVPLCYVLALMGKESVISFVLIGPLSLCFFAGCHWRKAALLGLPLLLGLAVFWALKMQFTAQAQNHAMLAGYWNNPVLLAKDFSTQAGTKLYILGRYVQLLLWPHPLTSSYFYNDIPILPIWHWKPLLALAAYLGLGYAVWRTWTRYAPIAFGLLAFGLALLPFSNLFMFVHYIDAMSERFLLTPSLGGCLALGAAFYALLPKPVQGWRAALGARPLVAGALALLLAAASLKTVVRNRAWANMFTLCQTDLQTSPESYLLNANMAEEYLKMAVLDMVSGKQTLALALQYFAKAVQLDDKNGVLWESYGRALAMNGNLREAAYCFEQCLRLLPERQEARQLLQRCYAELQQQQGR